MGDPANPSNIDPTAASGTDEVDALELASLVDQSMTAILTTDLALVVIGANKSARALFNQYGGKLDALAASSCSDIIGVNIEPMVAQAVGPDPFGAEPLPCALLIEQDRTVLRLHVIGRYAADGQLRGYFVEVSDLSQARENEAQAHRLTRQMGGVHATMAVIEFGTDGTIRNANENFVRITGYAREELIGQHHRLLCEPEYAASADYETLWQNLRAGRATVGDITQLKKDGSRVWLHASYVPMFDEDGTIVSVSKFAYDTSDSQQISARVDNAVEDLLRVIEAASQGDLTQPVSVSGSDAIGKLATAYEKLQQGLRSSLQAVERSANVLLTSSNAMDVVSEQMQGDIQDATAELTQARSDSQSVDQHIQSVSTAASEMSLSIVEIAKSATGAATVAQTAVGVARDVQSSVSALGHSSDEIGKVVKLITSIAQQTNLLALNATIEAARAGEAGRGFAVVANEVKELAKRTAVATEDIGLKIEAIINATRSTIEAIERVSAIIQEISEHQGTIASAVEQQNATTKEIERSAQAAAAGSQGFVNSMGSVEELSQSAERCAQRTRDASVQLSDMASSLHEVLSHFRLHSDDSLEARILAHQQSEALLPLASFADQC